MNRIEAFLRALPPDPSQLEGMLLGLSFTSNCAVNADAAEAVTVMRALLKAGRDPNMRQNLTTLNNILTEALKEH